MNIKLHQFAADTGTESASPFCVKVHRALALKGLSYEVSNIGSPSQLKKVNPQHRKLPVLEVDGKLISDSSAILRALDELRPSPPLWPADPSWQSRMLEDWADESLYWIGVYFRWAVDSNFEPFAKRTFGKLPMPLRWIVPKVARKQVRSALEGQGVGRMSEDQVLDRLREHLALLSDILAEQEWMGGKDLGAADLAVFGLVRSLSLPSMGNASTTVAQYGAVASWMKRVDAATAGEHTVPVP